MSLNSALSIARTALTTHQSSIQVTANNITNANTEGYSRQVAVVRPTDPHLTPQGVKGTGIVLADIARVRDTLLDATVREEHAAAAGSERRAAVLGELETLTMEPGEHGLGAALDAFYSAWDDLANSPTSLGARSVIRERAQQVVAQLQRLDAGVSELARVSAEQLNASVAEVNRLAQQVASLNGSITAAEAGGTSAGQLRDQRDLAIDQMARHADVRVIERTDGSVGVIMGSSAVVDGPHVQAVSIDTTGGRYTVRAPARSVVDGAGGAVGANLALVNGDLPAFRAALDAIASGLVSSVNAVHRGALNPAGGSGVDFFDPTRVTAATVRLSAAVAASVSQIGAAAPGVDGSGQPVYRAGANDIALAIAGLRGSSAGASVGGQPLGTFYRDLITGLAVMTQGARDDATVAETLAQQAETRRQSVSGVSTDEEMIKLIAYQNAYGAAARVVSAVDEMLQTLLDLKR